MFFSKKKNQYNAIIKGAQKLTYSDLSIKAFYFNVKLAQLTVLIESQIQARDMGF